MTFGALDEQQRRARIAVRHVDGVRRLLDVARDGSAQLFQDVIADAGARSGFDRLQRGRHLRDGGRGLLGHGLDLGLVLLVGGGRRQPIKPGVRRPDRGIEF
jgi:hypothetical protein